MIIESLLNFLYNIFAALTSSINIPPLPDDVMFYFDKVGEYFESGLSILAVFTPLDYLLILLGVVIAVDVAISIYHFVMWVLKKIPIASIN